MKILKMYYKVKYCEADKENNIHFAKALSTHVNYKKKWSKYAKLTLTVLVTQCRNMVKIIEKSAIYLK
jgi:hypothetical protein